MIEPDIATYGTAGAVGSVFLFIFVTLFLGFFFHGPCYQGRDKYLSSQKMDCRVNEIIQLMTQVQFENERFFNVLSFS